MSSCPWALGESVGTGQGRVHPAPNWLEGRSCSIKSNRAAGVVDGVGARGARLLRALIQALLTASLRPQNV